MKKIVVIGVLFLFIGVSIIPTTKSFPLKESSNPIENNATYKISQFNQRDMAYNEHLIYDPALEYDSRFLSKEKTRQYPRELFGYKEEDSSYQNVISTDMLNNGNYTPHAPIYIYSDEGFTYENGVTGGNGTENDPYIFEGWEINTNEEAIHIERTTAYFLIKNCLLKGVYGINLKTITVGSISNCIILSSTYGIKLETITVGSISNCNISSNIHGIAISKSTNITLKNNTLYDNDYNIRIYGTGISQYYHDIDTSNTVNGKPVYYLVNEHDIVIDENYDIGFLGLISCKDILVTDVTISDSYYSVLLVDSSNITVSSSDFSDSLFGIYLKKSCNNTIIGCNLVDASIDFWESPNTVMRETSISSGGSFSVGGYSLDDFYQDIDTSNTVNGKPMYYLVEEQDDVFTESNVGFLALVNCNNMLVENVKISNNGDGMVIAGTKAIIKNCETSNNFVGLYIFGDCDLDINNFKTFNNAVGCLPSYSSNIDFLNCDISGDVGCIQIDNSHDITIKDCIFRNSYDDGITLINSYNNEISNNKFSLQEGPGIYIQGGRSWGNTISHNNIHSGDNGIFISRGHNNTIFKNDIHDLSKLGIWLEKSVDNNIYRNNIYNILGYDWSSGIRVYESERCKINYNNINDNTIGLEAVRCNVNATLNWWGSATGPSGIGPGDGDSIKIIGEATVLYEPWLESPVCKSKQLSYGFSGLFMRLLERFPLIDRLLNLGWWNLE
jgi:parallel beta-helix repeat protein